MSLLRWATSFSINSCADDLNTNRHRKLLITCSIFDVIISTVNGYFNFVKYFIYIAWFTRPLIRKSIMLIQFYPIKVRKKQIRCYILACTYMYSTYQSSSLITSIHRNNRYVVGLCIPIACH